MRIYKNTFSFVILLSVLLFMATGCKKHGDVWQKLELADSLIEDRPDSSFTILKGISANDLNGKEEKARYALLMSMALDKNYIDTTTFDVLQPAIDYYLKKGTPDEKLRTYYYQGVIYKNQGDRDNAINSFLKAISLSPLINDSSVLARAYVAQALLYKEFHDYISYAENFSNAARIYRTLFKKNQAVSCLLSALNGYIVLNDKNKADSIINLLNAYDTLDERDWKIFQEYKLNKSIQFDSKDEIKKLLNEDFRKYDINGFISLSLANHKIGENEIAENILDGIIKSGMPYDTIRFLSVKVMVLRELGNYKDALTTYYTLSNKLDTIDYLRFGQKSKDIEEKYRLELQNLEETRKRSLIAWGSAIGFIFLMLVILVLILLVRYNKVQKGLFNERAKNIDIENHRLKLDRQKLSLEKEKLLLEADNLSHRVNTLEDEKESLKKIIKSQQNELPEEVQMAITFRIEMLNGLLAGYITNNDQYEKPYEEWIREIKENTEEFMNSNRLAFQASHPRFIKYFEDRGLTVPEINYVCLYALGLKGKEISEYIQLKRLYHVSSEIRKKLGMEEHETNIGLFIRKLLKSL